MRMTKIKRLMLNMFNKPGDYAIKIGVKMGKNCKIHKNVFWGSEPYLITMGDNVRITEGVRFITHDGGVHVLRNLYNEKEIDVFGKITIGNNVHIGMNSIIMPGVTIGNNCVVGCGAVVTKNVESNSVVVGIPAKKIESIEEYYEKVKKKCDYTKLYSNKEKKEYLLKKYNV